MRYRRTTILAITDGPFSPLASMTEHWCQLAVPAAGPFDSSVPAVAAAELLVAQVTRDLKASAPAVVARRAARRGRRIS